MNRSLLAIALGLITSVQLTYGQASDLSGSKPITTQPVATDKKPIGAGRLFAQSNTSDPAIPYGSSANAYGELNSTRPLKTGDTLDVKISKDLDLSVKVQVDKNGDVDIPYVGKVAVAGKTTASAIDTIQKKIADYFGSSKVDFPDAALPAIPVKPASPPPVTKETSKPPVIAPAPVKAEPVKPAVATKSDSPGIARLGESLSNLPWPNVKKAEPVKGPEPIFTPEPVKEAIPVKTEERPSTASISKVEANIPKISAEPSEPSPQVFSSRKSSEKLDVDFLKEIADMEDNAPKVPSAAVPILTPKIPEPARIPIPQPSVVEMPQPPKPPEKIEAPTPAPQAVTPLPATIPPVASKPVPSLTPAPVVSQQPKLQPSATPTRPQLAANADVEDKDAATALFRVLEKIAQKETTADEARKPDALPAAAAPVVANDADVVRPVVSPRPPTAARLNVEEGVPTASPRDTIESVPLVAVPARRASVVAPPIPEIPEQPVEEIRRAQPVATVVSPEEMMITPSERLIQVGDLVEIKMPDEPDLNLQARVTRDGKITLPYAGDVVIVGKALGEATKLIKSRLAGYYVHPVVTLNVAEPARGQFVILGQVERPGVYDIAGNSDSITLTEALAKASGTLRYGDIGKVTVKRTISGNEQMVTFDAKAMTQGAKAFNILPGDTIIVRLAKNEISILGEVRMPGLYSIPPMQDSVDLMEAIAMAGGAARFGDLGEVVIKRTKGDSEQILKVDAKAIGRNASLQKVPVYPGDTIIVRLLRNEFIILGQVQRPGTYSIPAMQDNVDLLEALAMAGGATRLANLNSITVRRTVNGEETVLTVNMNRLVHGERVERFDILPGDRIVISERMF